jgi:hypothetical protein
MISLSAQREHDNAAKLRVLYIRRIEFDNPEQEQSFEKLY